MSVMIDFINQGWFGSSIGIFGIILAIFFYIRSLRGKSVNFIFSPNWLLKPKAFVSGHDVKISYSGRDMARVSSTYFVLWNDGHHPISEKDVIESAPLRIKLAQVEESRIFNEIFGNEILGFRIVRCSNRYLKCDIAQENSNSILLKFNHLEKNDGFRLELLHTGSHEDLVFSGHISGLAKPIEKINVGLKNKYLRLSNSVSDSLPILGFKTFGIVGVMRAMSITLLLFGLLISILAFAKSLDIQLQFLPQIGIDNLLYTNVRLKLPVIFIGPLYVFIGIVMWFLFRRRSPRSLDVELDNEFGDISTKKSN